MSNEETLTKSISDQIIELMVSDIKKREEFTDQLIEKIEDLYRNDELKKSAKVIETIVPD